MAQALRDNNRITTLLVESSADSTLALRLKGDSTNGALYTTLVNASTSTRTTVTPALTSAALIAANTGRKGLRIVHTATDPAQNLWIAAAATATTAIYFIKITGSGEANLYDAVEWPYSGQYSIISDAASGTIQVYELT